MTAYDNVKEFVDALNAGRLAPPQLIVEGLVMPVGDIPTPGNEAGVAAFLFAPGTSCDLWIPVPASVVARIEHLGSVSCKDHKHEHVRLHLRIPETSEGPFLAKLIGHFQQSFTSVPFEAVADFEDVNAVWDRRDQDFNQPAYFGSHHVAARLNAPRWNPRCAACVAGNIALAAAIGAAIAAAAPQLLASPGAVVWLAGKFGISTVAASAALSGVGGSALAKVLCGNVC